MRCRTQFGSRACRLRTHTDLHYTCGYAAYPGRTCSLPYAPHHAATFTTLPQRVPLFLRGPAVRGSLHLRFAIAYGSVCLHVCVPSARYCGWLAFAFIPFTRSHTLRCLRTVTGSHTIHWLRTVSRLDFAVPHVWLVTLLCGYAVYLQLFRSFAAGLHTAFSSFTHLHRVAYAAPHSPRSRYRGCRLRFQLPCLPTTHTTLNYTFCHGSFALPFWFGCTTFV